MVDKKQLEKKEVIDISFDSLVKSAVNTKNPDIIKPLEAITWSKDTPLMLGNIVMF